MTEALDAIRTADAELHELTPLPFPVPCAGLEAVITGSLAGLRPTDWWVPGLRERIGAVQRGVPLSRLVDATAGAKPYKVAPVSPSPADRALYAVGLALSAPDRTALVHLGIGSMADGAVHEAFNLAALQNAPVIFVVAVHPLDGDAPLAPQLACAPSVLAKAFTLQTTTVDGSDPAAVQTAVETALHHRGPTLIEAILETSS